MDIIVSSKSIVDNLTGSEAQEDKYRMLCREQMTWIKNFIEQGNLTGTIKFIFAETNRFHGIERMYEKAIRDRAIKEFTEAGYIINKDMISW